SNRDMISKILQFDVDGDKLLVIADELLIKIAERNIAKYDVVPLYYDMKKANAEVLTNESLYSGMTKAYTGGNIGVISNDISKMWNSFKKEEDWMDEDEKEEVKKFNFETLTSIKLMCMENNFTIDYAKTLFKPTRQQHIDEMIKRYTKLKVPYFFKYAKDKSIDQVEEINESTVNRFDRLLKDKKFRWTATNVGTLDYRILMTNPDIEIDEGVICRYKELNKYKGRLFKEEQDRKKKEFFITRHIRNELLKEYKDIYLLTDMLVKFLFTSNCLNKNTLWDCFGHIIFENIKRNVKSNTKCCEVCGERFEYEIGVGKPVIMCPKCSKQIELEKTRERVKKHRKNN
ncbi:MAG: hypothetical protein ACRC1P_11365, partial [Cellulosilyticaceae bacterium]